jgi:hypothetical protein
MKKLRKNKAYSLYHTAWFLARRRKQKCSMVRYSIVGDF